MSAMLDYALLQRVANGQSKFACDSPVGDDAVVFDETLDSLRDLEARGLVSVRLRNYYRRRRTEGPAVIVARLTALGESLLEVLGRRGAPA